MTAKLTLFGTSPAGLADCAKHLPAPDESIEASSVVGEVHELATDIERRRPELVIAEVPAVSESDLGVLERALAASPASALILVTPDRSPDFLMRAMRSGVRELVGLPIAPDELRAAYARQLQRMSAMSKPPELGRVLAFVPAKGGSGATFLAANLAAALADRGKRVALLDLNLQFGDAATFVSDLRAERTIEDLARDSARIDGTFLEACMLRAAENLYVLAAPESPEAGLDLRPEAIERVVAVARQRFDFVVLDVGRQIDQRTPKMLDEAEAVFVVVQLTLPFIHDAKRVLDMLRNGLGYPAQKCRVLVNRFEKGGDVDVADVEKTLHVPVDLQVPNSFAAVAYSINHGVPILRHAPRDPVARAIDALADRYAPRAQPARGGWLRTLAFTR